MIKIAVDAMGGDYAPEEIVKGVNLALKNNPDLEIVLFGIEEEIKKYLEAGPRVKTVPASTYLAMGEKDPVSIIRTDRELSLSKAFKAVKDGICAGVVTSGPTQGAVVAAHLIIRRMEGMKRVAICLQLPQTYGKSRIMLDVGANTDIRPEHILQHAHFASLFYQKTRGVARPLIGLINIGTEEGKGREQEKSLCELLKNEPELNFYGNVEPKDILSGDCDIFLTDGFSGNLVMKTMEGTAKAIGGILKNEIKSSFAGMLGGLLLKKNLKRFKSILSAEEVGGALIIGVDGVVVKAHGNSHAYAFAKAIELCKRTIEAGVIPAMKERLAGKNE